MKSLSKLAIVTAVLAASAGMAQALDLRIDVPAPPSPSDSISDAIQASQVHNQTVNDALNGALLGHDTQSGGPTDDRKGGDLIALSCEAGTELLRLTNAGTAEIAAGTRIRWLVGELGARGFVRLGDALDAGASVRIAHALGGVDATAACRADVL